MDANLVRTRNQRRRLSKPVMVIAVLTLGAIAAGSVAAATHDRSTKKAANGMTAPAVNEELPLQSAYDSCNFGKGASTLESGDGGRTIIIDTGSQYGSIDGIAVDEFIGEGTGS